MNIFLHRDDLRVHDNHGLKKASEDSDTVPLYVDDPRIRERNGLNKRAFRLRGMKKLDIKYRKLGSRLHYCKGKTSEALRKICKEHEMKKIYFNRSYAPIKRSIEKEIRNLGLETKSFQDRLLVEPRELSQEYETFSPFYREWKEKEKLEPFGKPVNLAEREDISEQIQEVEPSADIPEPGEDVAIEKWRDFRDNRLDSYREKRDDMGDPKAVSRLSMYYSSGMIGLRKVISDVETMIEDEDESEKIRNYAKYSNELAWREFFYQVLWHNPQAINENYKDFENEIEWMNDTEEFKAWKSGETGVPFVDAGIRELRETGYMHNRTRQNVASFLTKHLMIDWRKGARFFREHLVDHDTASNNGGWQWAASTGTDSIPIRIFNPVKQARKYDPEAEYIKKWVLELRNLEADEILSWVEMGQKDRKEYDTEYPDPIINFNQRYHMGKKMFERALGKN